MGGGVRIIGLNEARRSLTGFERSLPRALRQAAGEAADMVVTRSRGRVPTGPGRNGHARDSIRKKVSGLEVTVVEGGPAYPYMPWLDFGGTIRKNSKKPVRRPFFKSGRYIWNVYENSSRQITDILESALRQAAESNRLDVD
jgi:hypothetical protein